MDYRLERDALESELDAIQRRTLERVITAERSSAIAEFCASTGTPGSIQAAGLPEDVRSFRMNEAVAERRAR